jgi:gas vesicle protein
MNQGNGNGMIAALSMGFLLGAATALLVAPKTGKENREVLSEQINRIIDLVRGDRNSHEMEPELYRSQRADYLH